MIATALTEMFGLQHPVVLGPMGGVSGGHLAATVSNAGGLGLVGGGYGDPAWLRTELSRVKEATSRSWGVGLITWSIDQAVFDRLNNRHGAQWMVELTEVANYFAFLSGMVNPFDVPAPPDGDKLPTS